MLYVCIRPGDDAYDSVSAIDCWWLTPTAGCSCRLFQHRHTGQGYSQKARWISVLTTFMCSSQVRRTAYAAPHDEKLTTNCVLLLIGASGGIGLATTRLFLSKNWAAALRSPPWRKHQPTDPAPQRSVHA